MALGVATAVLALKAVEVVLDSEFAGAATGYALCPHWMRRSCDLAFTGRCGLSQERKQWQLPKQLQ